MPLNNIGRIDPLDCTGCAACAQVCGEHAIRMEYRDGFAFPMVSSEACIGCGICLSVCQAHSRPVLNTPRSTLLAICRDSRIYSTSTSGGIFGGLARYLLDQGDAAVCGAAMFPDGSVRHIIVDCFEDLHRLQGSKYVQSDTSEVLREAESLLKAGRKLLFSGTPCQIAALNKYLGKEYLNLYTVDIVCHGVPSPVLFREHVRENLSDGKPVHSVSFRMKDRFERYGYHLQFTDPDGRRKLLYGTEDPYYRAFMEDLSLRESCYRCPYATAERAGDISVGDCGAPDRHPTFHLGKTISEVFINTEKGSQLWTEAEDLFDWEPADTLEEALANESMHGPAVRPDKRDAFYPCTGSELNNRIVETLGKVSLKTRVRNRFRRFVPECIRKLNLSEFKP